MFSIKTNSFQNDEVKELWEIVINNFLHCNCVQLIGWINHSEFIDKKSNVTNNCSKHFMTDGKVIDLLNAKWDMYHYKCFINKNDLSLSCTGFVECVHEGGNTPFDLCFDGLLCAKKNNCLKFDRYYAGYLIFALYFDIYPAFKELKNFSRVEIGKILEDIELYINNTKFLSDANVVLDSIRDLCLS